MSVTGIPRRRFLHLAAGAAALSVARSVHAETWPSRPIRWVVGFPPGGGADIVSRIMAAWLGERLGQQVYVENRPGASTNISIQNVIASPPDGYSLLFVAASAAVNPSLFRHLPFDLKRDIAPVAGLIDFPLVLVAHPSLPAKTVPELIAYAKAHPGKIKHRLVRRRLDLACGERAVQDDGGHRSRARALQGRRADGDRPHGRAGAARDRRHDRSAAA